MSLMIQAYDSKGFERFQSLQFDFLGLPNKGYSSNGVVPGKRKSIAFCRECRWASKELIHEKAHRALENHFSSSQHLRAVEETLGNTRGILIEVMKDLGLNWEKYFYPEEKK